MSDGRGSEAPRVQLLCGLFVVLTGGYLAVGSDDPLWLPVLQVLAGAVLAASAGRQWLRSRRADAPADSADD